MKQAKSLSIDAHGFSHYLVLAMVMVSVGLMGTYMLVASHADSNSPCAIGYKRKNNTCVKVVLTERQKLAKAILDEAKPGGNIKFPPTLSQAVDYNEHTTPRQNIVSVYQNRLARTTSNCAGRNGTPSQYRTAYISTDLLRFMRDLGRHNQYSILAITGQCHSSASSQHYLGRAVDIGPCPVSGEPNQLILNAKKVGVQYKIVNNSENCANASHYHFSFGGR